ncbi:hypothetical protein FKP32DRAFT_983387 [Trametes sanguinea]|nr:hypothetical protein FKP32DRAFT_983387 [Trametes sanguinea]
MAMVTSDSLGDGTLGDVQGPPPRTTLTRSRKSQIGPKSMAAPIPATAPTPASESEAMSVASAESSICLSTSTAVVETTTSPMGTLVEDMKTGIPSHPSSFAQAEALHAPLHGGTAYEACEAEEDGGAWMIWSNRRRRQPPRPPPPHSTIALNATRSRSSSIASDSRSIDSLFLSAPSTSTTPTSVASSSRRSSIALPSPSKPHPIPSGFRYRITIQTRTRMRTLTSTFDKPSDNKYSVLEAFEAEG